MNDKGAPFSCLQSWMVNAFLDIRNSCMIVMHVLFLQDILEKGSCKLKTLPVEKVTHGVLIRHSETITPEKVNKHACIYGYGGTDCTVGIISLILYQANALLYVKKFWWWKIFDPQ